LQNLDYEIGRGTIARVLKEAGVDPAPDREKRTSWKEFLRTHWEVLGAADFSAWKRGPLWALFGTAFSS
jgi:hypothetical protein